MFSKFHHVTVMVNDIEKAVQFYSSLDIGPFEIPKGEPYVDKTYRGKPLGTVKLSVRETHIGPVILQLVQLIDGECLQKEFINAKGQGVQHLGWDVDDIDKEEAEMTKKGIKVTQRGRKADGSGYTFFDTEEQAGVALEIRQGPPAKK